MTSEELTALFVIKALGSKKSLPYMKTLIDEEIYTKLRIKGHIRIVEENGTYWIKLQSTGEIITDRILRLGELIDVCSPNT